MATTVYNGTQSQTIANFNPATDQVIFEGIDAADVFSINQTNSSVTVTLTNGSVLTLGGVIFASLQDSNLVAGANSNLDFVIGSDGAESGADGQGNVIVGLGGSDFLNFTTDGSLVFGNQGDDTIVANSADANSDARLLGGMGNDAISGFGEGSVVYGGLNDGDEEGDYDVLTAAEGSVTDDGVTIYGGNDIGDADDGADVITGSLAGDLLVGNAGDDTINGAGGSDSIYGGRGADVITIGSESGEGNEDSVEVYGGLGEDRITGVVTGSASLYGGNGAADGADEGDVFQVSVVDDASVEIFGNAGDDTAVVFGNFGGGEGDVESVGSASVYGGQGDDLLATVGVETSVIYGGVGSDAIGAVVGADGSADLFGGNGAADSDTDSDILGVSVVGGDGTANLYGNGGADFIVAVGAEEAGAINGFGGQGNDYVAGTVIVDDSVVAISQADLTLYGNLGDDVVIGGLGSDSLYGGQGDDVLFGSAGGLDQLFGGAGADVFIGNNAVDGEGGNVDDEYSYVNDFVSGEDQLAFRGFDGSPTALTTLEGDFTTVEQFLAAATAEADQDGEVVQFTFGAEAGASLTGKTFVLVNTEVAADAEGAFAPQAYQFIALNSTVTVNDFADYADVNDTIEATIEATGFNDFIDENGGLPL